METLQGAPVTFMLLAANVLISLIAFQNREFLVSNLLSTRAVRGGALQRVVTSGFIHGSPAHLMVNMLTLYFFGPVLEKTVGSVNFTIIYASALIAGSAWALVENWRNPDYNALGASGAVSGVVLAFCMFYPTAMLGIFFVLPMPAFVFAILYVGLSAVLAGRADRRIAHEAHLGGALAGVAVCLLLYPGLGEAFLTEIMSVFQ